MALEVQIGADSSDLNKKIKEAEFNLKELSKVKLEQIKLGLDTKEINGNIASVKKSLNELKTASKDAGSAIGGMTPKVANGGNALMQFSRIAQDAPYGIIGIGNNITATVEAFGYLKNQTGSTGSALKAMAGSIMGSGGILLAVSLLTSGLTYMSQQGLSVGDVIDKMTGSFDSARKAMQDMNAEVAKNSQAQISSMNALVSAAKNVKISDEDRLIAVRKLQSEYPAYFGNLSKEEILNGNIAGAVRGVTAALIAKAKAAALTERIVKLAEEEEKIQNSVNNSITAQFKQYRLTKQEAYDAAVILNKQLRGEIDLEAELTAGRANALSKAEKTALAAFKYSRTLQVLGGELTKNRRNQDKLTESLNDSTAAYVKLEDKAVKATESTKKAQQKYKNPNPNFDSGNGFIGGGIVNPSLGLVTPDLGIDKAVIEAEAKLRAGLEAQELLIEDFNYDVSSLVEGSLTNTFSSLGDALGDALASGGDVLSAVGNSLLQSFGSFLSDMGGLLIQYGTLAVVKGKLDLAILSGGPVSIAAGVAAIGVGIALKAAGSAIGKAATGGSVSGGSVSTGASVSSPTSSNYGSSSSTGWGSVVFEISGNKLLGVLRNSMNSNGKLGGDLSFT